MSSNGEARAFVLYERAKSVAEAKGRPINFGLTTMTEFRDQGLTIHYIPSSGHLDVWYRRKVLTINRTNGAMKVCRYSPGEWEVLLLEGTHRS